MSENLEGEEKPESKQEMEDKFLKTQIELNTYQAAFLNKKLGGTPFRLDIFENVRKKISSSTKNKKKPKMASKPPQFMSGGMGVMSDDDNISPGSISSNQIEADTLNDTEPGISRRTSRREKKPTYKTDLGYEEPKPIKGVKLTSAAKEIFRKCEETLNSLKEDFSKVAEFSSKAIKFEQEIKKLRDGHYKNTMMLGNIIRKILNNLFAEIGENKTDLSSKVANFINKFEENFAGLDNKVLFEESKIEVGTGRK